MARFSEWMTFLALDQQALAQARSEGKILRSAAEREYRILHEAIYRSNVNPKGGDFAGVYRLTQAVPREAKPAMVKLEETRAKQLIEILSGESDPVVQDQLLHDLRQIPYVTPVYSPFGGSARGKRGRLNTYVDWAIHGPRQGGNRVELINELERLVGGDEVMQLDPFSPQRLDVLRAPSSPSGP